MGTLRAPVNQIRKPGMWQQCPRFRAQAQTFFFASIGFEFSTPMLGYEAQPPYIQPIGFVFSTRVRPSSP
jgi:hypothetical protein